MDGQSGQSGSRRLSFAHRGLTEIPYESILAQTATLQVLDLSYNQLQENPVPLGQLQKLSTLVLDGNQYTSHIRLPYLPSVSTLCINRNRLSNLPLFVEEVRRKVPNLRVLSMMDNEAAPSYFNGGTLSQYEDYRQYVISQIPGLEVLDHTEVLEEERTQARRVYREQRRRRPQKEERRRTWEEP